MSQKLTRFRRNGVWARRDRIRAAGLVVGVLCVVCGPGVISVRAAAAHPEQQEQAMSEMPSMVVTGRGEVSVRPDRAVLSAGVMVQEPTAESAMKQCAEAMQRVTAALRAQGVPEARIQTASISLSPVYERYDPSKEAREPKIVAYRADNSVRVEVDDLTKVGPVIDAAVKAGGNQAFGISFEIKDDLPHKQEALRRAVAAARTKAETIASALGRPLGEIMDVSEGVQTSRPQPMHRMRMAAPMAADSESSTHVNPGELRVEASVTLRYVLAPKN